MITDEMKKHINVKANKLHKVIVYTFYKKPMSNRTSNRYSSAMPDSMKIATTANEIHRRLRNCSRDLPYEIMDRVLINYMDELKAGGYP